MLMRATSPAKEPKVLDHRLVDLDPGYIFHLEISMNVWSMSGILRWSSWKYKKFGLSKGNILILRQFNTNFLYFKLDQRGMPLMEHTFIKISKWKMYPGSRSTSQRTKSPESQAIGSRSRIHFPFSKFRWTYDPWAAIHAGQAGNT